MRDLPSFLFTCVFCFLFCLTCIKLICLQQPSNIDCLTCDRTGLFILQHPFSFACYYISQFPSHTLFLPFISIPFSHIIANDTVVMIFELYISYNVLVKILIIFCKFSSTFSSIINILNNVFSFPILLFFLTVLQLQIYLFNSFPAIVFSIHI